MTVLVIDCDAKTQAPYITSPLKWVGIICNRYQLTLTIMNTLSWHTETRVVNNLIPYDKNPRTLSSTQLSNLKKSLTKFNLVEIPAIDTSGRIIAGHQRLRVMQLLGRGDEEIDVRVPNRPLTEQEYKQYLITSNRVTGDWDTALLREFDHELLLESGFDELELASFWDENKEVVGDLETEPEKPTKNIKTKLGDVITLGKSKLICGDSTDPKVLERLFGNEKASIIVSDPVYNISVSYDGGIGGKQNYGGNVNDTRTVEEYRQFISDSLKVALQNTKKDAHVLYFCDQIYIGLIQDVYRNHGLINKRVCIWLKNGFNPVPGSAFNKSYEPAVYATQGRPYISENHTNLTEALNKDIGTGNEVTDVWAVKRLPSKEYQHATSKPPELYQKIFLRCTKPKDIILDSFLGSGSSLIAAEQIDRRVYGCELEPAFCDVIVNRFEKLTGTKAIYEHEIGS